MHQTNVDRGVGPHAKRPELKALTGVRAIAALAVVLSHTRLPNNSPEPITKLASWGHIGVPLFFLLSGMVLAYNYPQLHFHDRRRTVLFYIARIARVMPLYWVMVLYSAFTLYASHLPQHPSAFVQNVFAIQTWGDDLGNAQWYYNGPGWSIGVEVFFYILFPFTIPLVAHIARRWTVRGLVAVLAVCTLISFGLWAWFVVTGRDALPATNPSSAHRWLYRNPLPHLTEFVGGLALAFLLPHARSWATRTHHLVQAVTVGFVVLVAAFHPDGAGVKAGSFGALFLVPFGLGLLSLGSDRGWFARLCGLRPMMALGTASYALYLTHRVLLDQLAMKQHIRDTPGLRGWVALMLVLFVLLLIAEGAHRYIENPLRSGIMRVARRLIGRRTHRPARDKAHDKTHHRAPDRAGATSSVPTTTG